MYYFCWNLWTYFIHNDLKSRIDYSLLLFVKMLQYITSIDSPPKINLKCLLLYDPLHFKQINLLKCMATMKSLKKKKKKNEHFQKTSDTVVFFVSQSWKQPF